MHVSTLVPLYAITPAQTHAQTFTGVAAAIGRRSSAFYLFSTFFTIASLLSLQKRNNGMENIDVKNILGLQLPTDPRWVNLAEIQLEEILTDHAYCEQKAATTCITLIQKNSEKELLVEELSPIVTEEWGHFRQVLAELKKRGLVLGRQRKDVYVNELLKFIIKGGSRDQHFLDQMLIMALIEARSCERFKRLSEGLDDEYMRKFYRKFMESEAGHYTMFINLAEHYLPKDMVRNRWKQWLVFEKYLMNSVEVRGDRIH